MPRLLLIETSHQPGVVAVAAGERILGQRRLDEARRHARDLAPKIKELLEDQAWRPRDLDGVVVGCGPGSYTGLRVGLMSAKTLAYAVGCRLLALDTFAVLARQAPAAARVVDVVADAQQDKLYAQRFHRAAANAWTATGALTIVPFDEWLPTLSAETWVTGPGLAMRQQRLPTPIPVVPEAHWLPSGESLLALGMERWRQGDRDDPFAVEPLYLRPSSAEEKWERR